MRSPLPKQYLPLDKKPIACHSLEVFLNHPAIAECIVVTAPEYRAYFSDYSVRFAEPGERRQDSLYNGLQLVQNKWVCIHDAARPFVTPEMLTHLIESGKEIGAASLAMPITFTIKQSDANGFVKSTLDRSHIWEVQTPQFLTKEILDEGFAYAEAHDITVTDDVSLAELIGHPVKLVPGSYNNFKITTQEDLVLCKNINSQSPTTAPTT